MLEILVLFFVANRIGRNVEAKGYKRKKYQLITMGLWFGGEIAGVLFGLLIANGTESAKPVIYFTALVGAFTGMAIAYLIANGLKSLPEITCPNCGNTGLPKDKFCRKCDISLQCI